MDNNSMAIRKLKFHMAGRNPQIVPCLVGPTGIGKTAIVHQVAKELGAELVYFNMAQQNQGDNALPVPHINAGQTLVQYALHHKFQEILDNPNKDFIVMCDELARAQIPVISEWMTVLNERQIQGRKFGKNVRFIAAMNPSSTMKGYEDTDYIATEMDPAHLTRFHFIYMKEDRLDWLKWAKENDIHEYVIRFLEDAKNIAYFYGQSVDDVRVRTPKGWEQLSDMLKDMETQGLFDDPSDDEIVDIKECPQRPLAKDQGFTGWLDATGQFHECTYGTHNEIAHNHNITDDDSAIYFACATSPISNSLTDVAETGYLKPTQAQLNWLEKYKDQMSPTQREMLDIK